MEHPYDWLNCATAGLFLKGFNQELKLNTLHPVGNFPFCRTEFVNPNTKVHHWVELVELPDGSLRATRGIIFEDEVDILEGNYGMSLVFAEKPSLENLRCRAGRLLMHFVQESGA